MGRSSGAGGGATRRGGRQSCHTRDLGMKIQKLGSGPALAGGERAGGRCADAGHRFWFGHPKLLRGRLASCATFLILPPASRVQRDGFALAPRMALPLLSCSGGKPALGTFVVAALLALAVVALGTTGGLTWTPAVPDSGAKPERRRLDGAAVEALSAQLAALQRDAQSGEVVKSLKRALKELQGLAEAVAQLSQSASPGAAAGASSAAVARAGARRPPAAQQDGAAFHGLGPEVRRAFAWVAVVMLWSWPRPNHHPPPRCRIS